MACNAIQSTRFDGTTFVCGPKVDDVPCAFCGAKAMLLCDWKVEKAFPITAREISVGDVSERGSHVIFFQVMAYGVYYALQTARGEIAKYRMNSDDTLTVLRTDTCDAAICAECGIERDAEHHICPDHWRAWETVA